jgi:2'-5' RNA ligase
MAYGVSAWFDESCERRVRGIWKDLHENGINSTLHIGPYRPHITLGIYETLDINSFTSSLVERIGSLNALPFILPSIGLFPDNPPAVFLNVTVTERLLSLHSLIHKLMAEFGSGPVHYYMPGYWNPHCTLAPDLAKSNLSDFIMLGSTLELPIEGTIDRIGVIDTPAEIELKEVPLRR